MRRICADGFRKLRWCIPTVSAVMYSSTNHFHWETLNCERPRKAAPPSQDLLASESLSMSHLGDKMYISDNLSLTKLGSHGKGWVCNKARIGSGETLFKVPADLILNASSIESDPFFENIVGPLRCAGLDDRGVLALWYLVNRNFPSHKWVPYLDLLPNHYDLLSSHLLLADERIPGTSICFTAERMKCNISRQLRSILASLRRLDPDHPLLTMDKNDIEQEWRLCHALVLSRSGLFDVVAGIESWDEQPIAVIPGIDFLNHSDYPNASISRCSDGSVKLVATRDIEPGDEITISYWSLQDRERLTMEQVLFTFGFIGGDDRFLIPMISFDSVDTDQRRAIQRLFFVEPKQVDHAKEGIYTDDVTAAVAYFAIESMPDRALAHLKRAILDEGGVKSKSIQIIDSYRFSGSQLLRSEMNNWKATIHSVRVSHPLLLEYQKRLELAIESFLSELR